MIQKDWARLEAFVAERRSQLTDPFALVNLGIVARDGERWTAADAIFRDLLVENPKDMFAHYELGVSQSLQGQHVEALSTFEKGLAIDPADERIALQVIKLALFVGDGDRADQLASSRSFSPEGTVDLRHAYSIGAYVRSFPLSRSLRIASAVNESAGGVMIAQAVGAEIIAAVKNRSPFLLVRAGDGEGSYTVLNALDDLRYEHLYRRNRQEFGSYWFGELPRATIEDFSALACGGLASVLAEADVLGLPSLNWISHEHKIFSPRGISTLTNLYRLVSSTKLETRKVCQQDIHLGLSITGFFPELFKEVKAVGVISCFPELPTVLEQKFGVEIDPFIKIPGEKYFATVIGEEAASGQHYPNVFDKVMKQLEVDLYGKVFLIAGGILGKFYAQQIRRSGGIALDIGSLADVWVRKLTRPGYENLDVN